MAQVEEKPNPDSIGTLLKTIQGSDARRQAVVAPTTVLTLQLASGPQKLSNLQSSTGLPFVDFSQAIGSLQQSGLIEVSGEPGQEVVQLIPWRPEPHQ